MCVYVSCCRISLIVSGDTGHQGTRKQLLCPPKLPVVVSGVVTKGDKDFTPAAAQVAHTKPQPSVQKLPQSHHINQHIHQPRK
ncbi:death-associated protein 1 [Tachysurus ichikawai]